MSGIDPYILCPICFGRLGERASRKSSPRQVFDTWTKPACFVCDGNGEVRASVAAERLVIDVFSEPTRLRLE